MFQSRVPILIEERIKGWKLYWLFDCDEVAVEIHISLAEVRTGNLYLISRAPCWSEK